MMREVDKGNGWKIREILGDKGTTDRTTFYFYKGRQAPRIELTSLLAQQLAGFALIEKDLRNVLAWLKEIETVFPKSQWAKEATISPDRTRFNVVKGLYVASVAFYAKCFTQCEGRRAQLNRSNLDEVFREPHDEVMRQRHNYVAHSGADRFEQVKVALVLPPTKTSVEEPKIWKELTQPDMLASAEDEKTFEELATHAREKVVYKIDSLETKIFHEEILPRGKDYWYRKGKR